jgi:hypothetical protein
MHVQNAHICIKHNTNMCATDSRILYGYPQNAGLVVSVENAGILRLGQRASSCGRSGA